MGPIVTIRQLFKLSGFSISTVSKALNDKPDINLKVKHKIKGLAKSVNYIPNNLAAALRNRKTNIIALIVQELVIFILII